MISPSKISFLCVLLTVLLFLFSVITFQGNSPVNTINNDIEPPPKIRPKVRLPPEIFPDNTDDEIVEASGKDFPVHLVRYYLKEPTKPADNLCWVECLALMSVMLYIQPSHVYIHTNYPDFWPLDSCGHLIVNLTSIKIVHSRRRFTVNGRRLNAHDRFLAHEADLVKFMMLYKYGGIALDFDVFALPNVTNLLSRLDTYNCIASKEPDKINVGFLACHKGSPYIGDILRRYRDDYKPSLWVYNSGEVPWEIYKASRVYQKTVYIDKEINDNPFHATEDLMWTMRGIVKWEKKPAYHSLFHNCTFGERMMIDGKTSLTDLMRSIFDVGRRSPMLMSN